MKLPYDLHIHSCLSPCADDDMTPNNIAGMGALCGLRLMALTDHNSCQNCAPFLSACERYGIIGICGMELTTAEDIHIICLFPSLDAAMTFEQFVSSRRSLLPNKPRIFGNQFLCDEQDNIIGTEESLLIYATSITVEEALECAWEHGGIAYPAHIDRESNSIEAVLGAVPRHIDFLGIELCDKQKEAMYRVKYPLTAHLPYFNCSDAHRLVDIREDNSVLSLCDTITEKNAAENFIETVRQRQKL